jgi:hypothetical protein
MQVLICKCPKEHMMFSHWLYFLGEDWMRKHIIINSFEAFETLGQTLVRSLQNLLKQYGLTKKIFAYVKGEGANLNTVTTTLKSIISCETLCVMESF